MEEITYTDDFVKTNTNRSLPELEMRMYALVLYNISPIQQGIQAQHAITEYAQAYFTTPEYQRWAGVDKTTIILNGGSSIKLREHIDYLLNNKLIDLAFFKEPDLDKCITACCFLADERIWNREKYPDRLPEIEPITYKTGDTLGNTGTIIEITPAIHRTFDLAAFKEQIGGEANFLLKEFLSKLKKA